MISSPQNARRGNDARHAQSTGQKPRQVAEHELGDQLIATLPLVTIGTAWILGRRRRHTGRRGTKPRPPAPLILTRPVSIPPVTTPRAGQQLHTTTNQAETIGQLVDHDHARAKPPPVAVNVDMVDPLEMPREPRVAAATEPALNRRSDQTRYVPGISTIDGTSHGFWRSAVDAASRASRSASRRSSSRYCTADKP
jgi:hypothetical protein